MDTNYEVSAILTTANGLTSNDVRSIAIDPITHQIWVASTSDGVTILDANHQVIATLTEQNGLANNSVYSIAVDPIIHQTWVGTFDGVTVLDGNRQVITTLTLKNGIADGNIVWSIAIDSNTHQTWFGTDNGVTVLAPTASLLWLRPDVTLASQLSSGRLLDTQQLAVNMAGGSLVAPPFTLGYRILLTDTHQSSVTSETFDIGALGTAGTVQVTLGQNTPLAFHPHRWYWKSLTVICNATDYP